MFYRNLKLYMYSVYLKNFVEEICVVLYMSILKNSEKNRIKQMKILQCPIPIDNKKEAKL